MDSGADFKAGKPRNGNEMCFIFSEYSICDHENSWSNDLGNLISMIFFFLIQKKTKDHDHMILQIAISVIHDP